MKDIIKWLNDALASRGIVHAMNHYCFDRGEIKASDGRITAGHPWDGPDGFLVPGSELEKVLARLPEEDPSVEVLEVKPGTVGKVRIKAGRFRGDIETQPTKDWTWPDLASEPTPVQWHPIPPGLIDIIRRLRPFMSDNATQPWALSICVANGWAYATNNVSIAGAPYEAPTAPASILIPVWACDFISEREDRLTEWAWSDRYVGFRWDNGAWMRSSLIEGKYPDTALGLVQKAWDLTPPQPITPAFREAYKRVQGLADDDIPIDVYADHISSRFGHAQIEEGIECAVPPEQECSRWGGKFLANIIENADAWDPAAWPQPAAWKSPKLAGFIMGRRS